MVHQNTRTTQLVLLTAWTIFIMTLIVSRPRKLCLYHRTKR
nr:unnamed protein product [Callosobruchus chinensis]